MLSLIPEKLGAVNYNKHRTIGIMSQVAKIVLEVIDERQKRKVAKYVDEEQYDFRKGKGPRNAVFVLEAKMEISLISKKSYTSVSLIVRKHLTQ